LTDLSRDPYLNANGKLLLTAEAWVPQTQGGGSGKIGLYGILTEDVKVYWDRGMGVKIAQLYDLVVPGLILSKHVFQGLRRRLFCDDVPDADRRKLIYSRKPAFDVEINKGTTLGGPEVIRRVTPKNMIFFVVVSPNDKHRDLYPMLDGWLDWWGWVQEDPGLPEAPVNWLDRYDKKLFSGS